MYQSLPIPLLIDEWLRWAKSMSTPVQERTENDDLIGFDEFDWVVRHEPEKGWTAILTAVADPRVQEHLGTLAAGPVEDLLSYHGEAFIERIEREAKANSKFAWVLGGVWQCQMTDEIWGRVQKVWDRRGWDGNPPADASQETPPK